MPLSELAKQFVELRRLSGWTNTEIADRLYITQPHVSQVCSGSRQPSPALLNNFKLTLLSARPDLEKQIGLAISAEYQGPSSLMHDEAARRRVPNWAEELLVDLEGLEDGARQGAVAACRGLVSTFPKRKVSYASPPTPLVKPRPPARPRPSPAKLPPLSSPETESLVRAAGEAEAWEDAQRRGIQGQPGTLGRPGTPPASIGKGSAPFGGSAPGSNQRVPFGGKARPGPGNPRAVGGNQKAA